jgi:zinc protease
MKNLLRVSLIVALVVLTSFQKKSSQELSIPFEKYKLSNGLNVILHQDKSDPIVSVAIYYHVGSNREVKGRTGFAHLFEHIMFQESENVPQDQFFKYIQGAGGTLNGSTSFDRTNYYEVVPKNALEMVLWMESDRMGYLTNTITEESFANQQNVVQNEKRQNYDNRAYGLESEVIAKALYPDGHPYSWTVIGNMEDLKNATLEDVKNFHNRYYIPNNATIAIAGDFDPAEAKAFVQKYFGEIPAGPEVVNNKPMPVTLKETKKLYHEDNFAKVPEYTRVYPVPQKYSKDSYSLSLLAQLLGQGKKSPFYSVLVKDKKLTSDVGVYNSALELAGQFVISVTTNPGVNLNDVESAINEAFAKFEKDGITDKDMERVKAGIETSFYNRISSVQGKAFNLAEYNVYTGDPAFYKKDIENYMAVTINDIKDVYNRYIKDHNFVATSFVPKGQVNLIANGSVSAGIVEENILNATEVKQDQAPAEKQAVVKTPCSFDRSVKPALGPDVKVNVPTVWKSKLSDGMDVYGISQNEVPLIQYSIVIKGGHMLDNINKPGVANFMAEMLTEGTKNKTPEELEESISLLGAFININADNEKITVNVNTLTRNLDKTVSLVEEMLLQPRWDTASFALVRNSIINDIRRRSVEPSFIASSTLNKLRFGKDNIYSTDVQGTIESVKSITMDDLKAYYEKYISPSVAQLLVVGNVDKPAVEKSFASLGKNWKQKDVTLPSFTFPQPSDKPAVYFVDVPGAKQSFIAVGCLSIPRSDPDFNAATVANYKLGGSFNGYLNLVLREEKGFTYGARSGFTGYLNCGTFTASSSVRSNATLESTQIFRDLITKYNSGVSQEDVDFTKSSLLKGNALNYETLRALMEVLNTMAVYKLPADYIGKDEAYIRSLTVEEVNKEVKKYIDPAKMYYVVVGDAATQLQDLSKLGFGDPILCK